MSAYKAYLYYLIENFLLSSIEIPAILIYILHIGYLQLIYSYSSWKSFKYLWAKAYSAEYLCLGLKTNNFLSKSNPSYVALGKRAVKFFFLGIFVVPILLAAKVESIA